MTPCLPAPRHGARDSGRSPHALRGPCPSVGHHHRPAAVKQKCLLPPPTTSLQRHFHRRGTNNRSCQFPAQAGGQGIEAPGPYLPPALRKAAVANQTLAPSAPAPCPTYRARLFLTHGGTLPAQPSPLCPGLLHRTPTKPPPHALLWSRP